MELYVLPWLVTLPTQVTFADDIHRLENSKMKVFTHTKCRNSIYPFSNVARLAVPDELLFWSVKFENYTPPEYNSPVLQNKPWADPAVGDRNFKPKWNTLDNNVNRVSYTKAYEIVDGRPLNPIGRTGLCGRGVLGRWGPNHAADPIVTRWKTVNNSKELHKDSKLPILQFCAIQRRDNGEWAIPGGMVDPGEHVSETLKREFMEEALNSLKSNQVELKKNKEMIGEFFRNGVEVYKGYCDDPRNTDNSWMETVAYNFHDENGEHVGKFPLNAGDDAKNVQWVDANRGSELYASHSSFIEAVAHMHRAHW